MKLEDKITYFLQREWEAGDETKKEALGRATMYLENIWETISDNPNEGYTVDGLIKGGLVQYVDAYAEDAGLTEALKEIIEEEKGAA